MSEASTKPTLVYYVRDIHDIKTGDKIKRSFPIVNKTITLDMFCAEMAKDDGFMAGKASHIKGFISNMFSKILEELQHGNAVTLNDYVRFYPAFRGKMDSETGKPTSETLMATRTSVLAGMQVKIGNFTLVNREGSAAEPKFTGVYSSTGGSLDLVVRGRGFSILGRNLSYNADLQDTVTVSYTNDDEVQTLALTPADVAGGYLRFDFPEALTSVADKTELEFTLRTRLGVEGAAFSVASRKAILVNA